MSSCTSMQNGCREEDQRVWRELQPTRRTHLTQHVSRDAHAGRRIDWRSTEQC